MDSFGHLVFLLALALGLAHAVYMYRREAGTYRTASDNHAFPPRMRALYWAFWTVVLWAVLGPYVVVCWLLALVPYLIARARGKIVATDRMMVAR